MTDEELQKLCERLRKNGYDVDAEHEAADEIERLVEENKRLQEDAEAWRRRND